MLKYEFNENDILISRKEAARMLGLQPQTLAQWVATQKNDLPFLKFGNVVRYKKSDVKEFIERSYKKNNKEFLGW